MYPRQEDIFVPLLNAIAARGGEIHLSSDGAAVERELAEHFSLTEEERDATSPKINAKGGRIWRNHIQWTRAKLVARGYIDNSVRNRWKITENGNVYLKRYQPRIEPEPPQESSTVEIRPSSVLEEGAPQVVRLTRHERNLEARAQCLKHYGITCFVCGFNFGERYGPNAARLIHVHHLKPLSTVEKRRKVDPIIDRRPVCPNCHAVIHMNEDALSIDDVRAMLQDAK